MPTSPSDLELSENPVARGIDSAASALHEHADRMPGGEKVARAAHGAADAMQSAADYVRDRDLKRVWSDTQRLAKENPGATLLVAAALGFLLARTLSRG